MVSPFDPIRNAAEAKESRLVPEMERLTPQVSPPAMEHQQLG